MSAGKSCTLRGACVLTASSTERGTMAMPEPAATQAMMAW
jgi:hypothetical protein